jgi:predicted SAM-dependent methyltransferase
METQARTRRLHIGGKERKDGWEIFDAVAGAHVDHLGDAGDLACFADATFAAVYASHVLEHFDFRDQIPAVLREWRRVLQPGGMLYVSVPDLERLCHLYATPRLPVEVRFDLMTMIFGGHDDRYDYHLAGLDEDLLKEFLREAGFVSVRRVGAFGLFEDSSVVRTLGVPISLNMIAERAADG